MVDSTYPAQVIYEDEYLLALTKPQGIVVENAHHFKNNLEAIALNYSRSQTAYPNKCFIGVPHRLDRPVSGIVLFARKKSVLKSLVDLFSKRKVSKKYLAVLSHLPAAPSGHLTDWLVKDEISRKAILHDHEVSGSVKAQLTYSTLEQNGQYCLVEIGLITGKYHQIRAQLSKIGCPIVGDAMYGSSETYRENAIGLHAFQLSFEHPITAESLILTAPVPDDSLWNAFASLRK